MSILLVLTRLKWRRDVEIDALMPSTFFFFSETEDGEFQSFSVDLDHLPSQFDVGPTFLYLDMFRCTACRDLSTHVRPTERRHVLWLSMLQAMDAHPTAGPTASECGRPLAA